MRTTLLAPVAVAALIGLGGAPATALLANTASEPEQHRERGVVLECTGTGGGHEVYVSLYENDRFGNVVQVVVDDDPATAGHREPRDVLRHGVVRTRVRVDGTPAVVTGPARRVGPRTAVHEVHDDAGKHIVIDGTHRRLRADLVLRWDGAVVPLDCATAFAYDLEVTTTDAA